MHIHWKQASSPLAMGRVRGFRLIDGPASGVENFGGLHAGGPEDGALLYGEHWELGQGTKYPVGCKRIENGALPQFRGQARRRLTGASWWGSSDATTSKRSPPPKAVDSSGRKALNRENAAELRSVISGGMRGDSAHSVVLLWVKRQAESGVSVARMPSLGHKTSSAERTALIRQIVLETVPISVPTTVQTSPSTFERCATLIERWSTVGGIQFSEVHAATQLLQAAQSAAQGGADDVGGADSEMECEMQKEMEKEMELSLTEIKELSRSAPNVVTWRWADLAEQPSSHPAFYALRSLKLRTSKGQRAILEREDPTFAGEISLDFPPSLLVPLLTSPAPLTAVCLASSCLARLTPSCLA